MDPKWEQMGAQNVPKIEVMQKSAECGLDPLFTIYSHYRHLPKPYFLTPRSNQNASLFRVVPRMPPRGCKMPPPRPKNGETGVPRDPQGCQRGSQCLPKCSQNAPKNRPKISTLSRTASKGAPGVPRVPPRPQNTPIFADQLSQTAARHNRFTDALLHPTHFLTLM